MGYCLRSSPELIARGFLRFKHNGKPSFMSCLGVTLSIRESWLPVVVSSDRLELHPCLPLLRGRGMGSERIAALVRIQHHNLTCYLRQSVERRRINVTGFNCTTFLKALCIQQPDPHTSPSVASVATDLECSQK